MSPKLQMMWLKSFLENHLAVLPRCIVNMRPQRPPYGPKGCGSLCKYFPSLPALYDGINGSHIQSCITILCWVADDICCTAKFCHMHYVTMLHCLLWFPYAILTALDQSMTQPCIEEPIHPLQSYQCKVWQTPHYGICQLLMAYILLEYYFI